MDMEKVTIEDGQSANLVNENLEQLKNIFPEAFTEDGVDFATFRQLLGDTKVLEEGEERYSFNWHGKKAARQLALTPSTGTLLPCPEESVDWNNTQNLFIEGDNLEVLKLLQKSYANKIKMIYIDPPYNTGKDFVYKDSFGDNIKNYLEFTGQTDEEGARISSNTESGGRYHTNWLNMMYPRLKLARNLLKDDGVIFISIDDNEAGNIRKLCDEIFGSDNFVTNAIWEKKFSPQNDAKWFSDNHDHIFIYAKTKELWRPNKLPRTEETNSRFRNPDNDPRGLWASSDMTVKSYNVNYDYAVTTPAGIEISPTKGRCWSVSKEKFKELTDDNRIWFGSDGKNVPRYKTFLNEIDNGVVPLTIWKYGEVGHNQEARQETKKMFDGNGYFDSPKPVRLLSRIAFLSTSDSDIILDFFAGSATTAHAVMDLNAQDDGSRKFIMVQLPEACDEKSEAFKAGYKTIAEISKERIRRAGEKIQNEHAAKVKKRKDDLFAETEERQKLDTGFKVFKLATSNIRAWNPTGNLEEDLFNHQEHLIDGRSEDDILYELLIKRGVELTTPIQERVFLGKKVYCIGYGVSFACLAEVIGMDDIEELANGIIRWYKECSLEDGVQVHVFFRDSAFADNRVKANMTETLKQYGITHVKSL